jgi:small subunit ribosomal protein S11
MRKSILMSKNQIEKSPSSLHKESNIKRPSNLAADEIAKQFRRSSSEAADLRSSSFKPSHRVGFNSPKYEKSADSLGKKRPQKVKHTNLPGKRIKRKALPIIFIQSTLNNTILTLTDKKGNPLAWSSPGKHGLKNSRKKGSYAAQLASSNLAKVCMEKRIKMLEVRMKGLGKGKRTAISTLKKAGLKIKRLIELTPVPFNGCRPPKKRRT